MFVQHLEKDVSWTVEYTDVQVRNIWTRLGNLEVTTAVISTAANQPASMWVSGQGRECSRSEKE